MPDLPMRPDLDQLRHQAKDLLRAVKDGRAAAAARIAAVSGQPVLASAQLAVAREYGFPSWARLKAEVQRRRMFDAGDVTGLRKLLAEQPELACERMEHWCDHQAGADTLGYLAMLRFDARRRGEPTEHIELATMARALIEAGAPVEGSPGATETPLITAASYGDAEVARILIAAGADLEATASPHSGGVPGATALRHAGVFGMTHVVDVLVEAGASTRDLIDAAAAGNLSGYSLADRPVAERVAALRMAAGHERLGAIDQFLGADTPIDGRDGDGSTALHEAAWGGRTDSVRHLLARGADPALRDTTFHSTALGWCRNEHENRGDSPGHTLVEGILAPVSPTDDPHM